MGLDKIAMSERLHIGIFGMRNAGKSSVINAITGQEVSIVSDFKGTTTDPVKKTMELLPIGPIVIIDTPGLDDTGTLGEIRVQRAKRILEQIDIAVVVVDSSKGRSKFDDEFINKIKLKKVPYIVVYNKSDLLKNKQELNHNEIYVSTLKNENIYELKELIGSFCKNNSNNKYIVSDFLKKGDVAILVTPIDESAPKGRLILPQQLVLREILDNHCTAILCQESELERTLGSIILKPKIVITDSQAFERVSRYVPNDIALTSFSILFARYKGFLDDLIKGVEMISKLKTGDKILISESCTHHRQCNDIGTVKLPYWLEKFTKVKLSYDFTSGTDFPTDLSKYKLIIHCGGCMSNENEIKYRVSQAHNQNIPITNYGMAIAYMNGILKRSLSIYF